MNRCFYFLVFLCLSVSAKAQKFPSDFWHDGKVILDTGDTLRGQVKYSMRDDVVQFQSSRRLETFTARKIVTFEIFDVTSKAYREFYTVPYAVTGQYKAPVFFELLAEGKLTLLGRESIEKKTYSSYYYYGGYTQLILVNKFFFLKDDGSIQPFSGKKNDLLSMMGTKGDEVQKYMKENKLDLDRKLDFARVVAFYNSGFRPQ